MATVLLGACWKRCQDRFLRNVLSQAPDINVVMVAATVRAIFAQPDLEHVHEQFEVIAAMPGGQASKVEAMMRAA